MWSFWRSRERFSLEELKYLYEQLQRATIINDSNKDFVIETLRSMAELLIWGDQHDPSFFEFFMEKQVMGQFIRILKTSRSVSVTVQLLQTLNILLQSMRSEQAIYYLFSNEYINNVITHPFNFQNEELVAYYISFLRTISTKLDANTVSFFVKTETDNVVSFPLYTEAIKFAGHEESMVRIAVRTLTLHIYNINDKAIRAFIMSSELVDYFLELVTSLKQQTLKLIDLVTEAARNPESQPILSKLYEAIAETGDLLFYCNDIINAGVSELSRLMTRHILDLLVIPVLIPSLRPVHETEMQSREVSSLYLLCCILQVVKERDLVNRVGLELLRKTSRKDGTYFHVQKVESDASVSSNDEKVTYESSRVLLLSYLFCGNDKLVLASLNVLVAMLENKVLNEALLDALGILPQRKRYKKLLLQALVGSNDDDEVLFSPLPLNDGTDHVDLDSMTKPSIMSRKQQEAEEKSCAVNNNNADSSSDTIHSHDCESATVSEVGQLSPRTNRPPPCAEALWHTGWLLRQLLPYHEQKLRDYHLWMLNEAYMAAQKDLVGEVKDCWCDLVPSVTLEEWKICKKASETSALKKDTSFVLWPNPSVSFSSGDTSSSYIKERMQASVKVFLSFLVNFGP
ncbi:hypothetical protein KP509_1Z252700 [Ceratopteris richardii]|nr:hypothetical protein KP509_1Z252700 [Ceratopteris richardii]